MDPSVDPEHRAAEARSGLVTGALMLATVAGELVAPWLAARCGHRVLFDRVTVAKCTGALPALDGPVVQGVLH